MSHLIAAAVGFIAGSMMMLQSWDDAAKRGTFEVGHVVYRATPVEAKP